MCLSWIFKNSKATDTAGDPIKYESLTVFLAVLAGSGNGCTQTMI